MNDYHANGIIATAPGIAPHEAAIAFGPVRLDFGTADGMV